MYTVNKFLGLGCLLMLASIWLGCSEKKQKVIYDEVKSAEIVTETSNFTIKIFNPSLKTMQELSFNGKRMGDFFKIENHSFRQEVTDSTMVFAKSYLIDAAKFNQLQGLIKRRVEDDSEKMIFTTENPLITEIILDSKTGKQTKSLDVDATVVFELAVFKILEADTAAPKAVEIPTH